METGTLGQRRADVDALYAEAKKALGQSANQLRSLTERLREMHADELLEWQRRGGSDGNDEGRERAADVSHAAALLTRLELTARRLDETWSFLERGQAGDWSATGRSAADALPLGDNAPPDDAMVVLEAQEQERARLAEELHDGPAQSLSNAVFRVDIVERAMRVSPEAASAELLELRVMLEREAERLRDFISLLRPGLDTDGDLDSALQDAAAQLRSQANIEVAVDLQGPAAALDAVRQTAALRVALEALRNVRKHSAAQHCRLSTRLDGDGSPGAPGAFVLEVQDDGRGFAVSDAIEQTTRRHFGLRFMRERAQLVGAHLDIVSDAATGTTVRLRLDLHERS